MYLFLFVIFILILCYLFNKYIKYLLNNKKCQEWGNQKAKAVERIKKSSEERDEWSTLEKVARKCLTEKKIIKKSLSGELAIQLSGGRVSKQRAQWAQRPRCTWHVQGTALVRAEGGGQERNHDIRNHNRLRHLGASKDLFSCVCVSLSPSVCLCLCLCLSLSHWLLLSLVCFSFFSFSKWYGIPFMCLEESSDMT